MFDEMDLQLRLLSSDPIFVDGIGIQMVSIKDIAKYGYKKYFQVINAICLSKEKITEILELGEVTQPEELPYIFLVQNMINDSNFYNDIMSILSMIFTESPKLSADLGCLIIGDKAITSTTFLSLQSVIRMRNNLCQADEDYDNPENERVRQILEKRKRCRERLANSSHHNEPQITLGDLVSILSSCMNMTIENVMKYDLYQFNDQFCRLSILKEYEVNIEALMHGAKAEDIELKHWLCRINNQK